MMFQISLGMAVIGFAAGFAVGSRIATFDRNLPVTAGIAGAVIFYLAAHVLLIAAAVGLFAIAVWLAIRAWPTVHEAVIEFGKQAGWRLAKKNPAKSFTERLDSMYGEYQRRATSIRNLQLHKDDMEECLEAAETRLADEVKALANTPYDQDIQR